MASEVYLKQTKKQRNTAWNRKAPLIFFQQERGWVSDTQSSGQDAASDLLLWDGSWLRLPHELRRSLQVHSKPASHCTVPGETNATPVTRSVPRELQGAQRSCRTADTAERAKRRRSPGASLQAAGLPGSGPGAGLLTKHHGQNAA